jgi:SAM-dependent methyltransferase
MKTLDLGCGLKKMPGAIGVDIWRGSSADVIADLDSPHLPFRDDVFEKVEFNHVIEHIWDTVHLMDEIWRVTAHGAIVEGATPHFSSSGSYADPTHCHHFACRTFAYFSFSPVGGGSIRRLLERFYHPGEIRIRLKGTAKFCRMCVRLSFNAVFARVGIDRIANIYPELYEAFFCSFIHARDIVFRLKTVKDFQNDNS